MNILHTESATGWGGQEIRVLQEAKKTAEKGHKVTLLCQPGSKLAEKCKGVESINFSYVTVKIRYTLDIFAFYSIYSILKIKQIDIVHTHSSIDSWIGSLAARTAGIKVVRGRHLSIKINRIFPKYLVYSFLPHKIIASGNIIADIVRKVKHIDKKKVVSIPSGVNFKKFDYKIKGNRIREEFGIDKTTTLIGCVAVLRKWKGHVYFIDAAIIILKKYKNAKFLIVGDGPQYANIKKYLSHMKLEDSFIMTGQRQDIPEIMAAIDIFVLASISNEGIPQVISQAFAMKKCIVTTIAGGIPEVVINRTNGLLVPPEDGAALGEAIISLLDDHKESRLKMAQNGYDYVVEHLSEDKMVADIINLYKRLLGK